MYILPLARSQLDNSTITIHLTNIHEVKMTSIRSYTISVPQVKIDRLKSKLALADFPDEVEDVGWSRGAPLADVKHLTQYWQEKFDWRAVEAKLNELPQFTAEIQAEGFEALKIHFVHQKSDVEEAIPLLFVHPHLMGILIFICNTCRIHPRRRKRRVCSGGSGSSRKGRDMTFCKAQSHKP
jgi:hypothetical protein